MKQPDYIIIGAQRSGTTTLQALINQHPNACATAGGVREELHFFCWYRRQQWGMEWYKSRFPKCKVAGEKSPMYLQHPLVPGRISMKGLHGVRFIVLLRNPIDRAWSNWFKAKAKGFVKGRFMTHCEQEGDLLARELAETNLFWQQYYWGSHHHLRGILDRGKYAKQLTEWFLRFGREQFLIIRSEQFFAQQAEVIQEVYNFLGLPEFTPNRKHKQKLTYHAMPKTTRAWLANYYKRPNQKLEDMLRKDMQWT